MKSRKGVLPATRRPPDRPPFDLALGSFAARVQTFRARAGAEDPYDDVEVGTRMVWPGLTRLTIDLSGYLRPLPPQSTVGADAGLLLAPTHAIEPEVLFENIVGFVDSVRGEGR